MQKYKLVYKEIPDWELILPVFIKREDIEVVSSFFLSKGIDNVEYTGYVDKGSSVTKVPNCSVVRELDNIIITRYKQIPEICKSTDLKND